MKKNFRFFKALFCAAGLLLAPAGLSLAAAPENPVPGPSGFVLPELPYPADALAPVIGEETVKLHHGKHLKGYIDNLNRLVAGTPLEGQDLRTVVVRSSEGPLFNNAAQALNHILYFNSFSPEGQRTPAGPLLKAIEEQWGSFENFKRAFSEAGTSLFGSGWVWLVRDGDGRLSIVSESNAGNPVTWGLTPLLGIDVWEHAYYLDYQNRRGDHLDRVWDIIDWDRVARRY